jgi:hypothetical protein
MYGIDRVTASHMWLTLPTALSELCTNIGDSRLNMPFQCIKHEAFLWVRGSYDGLAFAHM